MSGLSVAQGTSNRLGDEANRHTRDLRLDILNQKRKLHRLPSHPQRPDDRPDDSKSTAKRRQEFSAAFSNAVRHSNERQLRENSQPSESSNVARPSVKAQRGAQRLAAAEPQPNTPLLTPPLTPSSSLRTVSSVESSPVDATGPPGKRLRQSLYYYAS
ncbi:hypothetical protein VNI00_018592 [Paramarasmius palmivorus]|uniref:Uncharacterized protein n=1 Tax=Paramarasmius palmivorus TaxID=297713 RepID=A0AAW0AWA7_9AGAR